MSFTYTTMYPGEPYPLLPYDGTSIHYYEEFIRYMEKQGISQEELESAVFYGSGVRDWIQAIEDSCDEHERGEDGYSLHLRGLIDEVQEICLMLESGKKGRGYTKADIADKLRYACHQYEM